MKLDWKIYSVAIGALLLVIMLVFLEKIFFFLAITLATLLVATIIGFLQPLKYMGIELVTLSSMLVGIVYGPVLGGLYAFTILLVHFILGRYHMGTYLAWVIPGHVLLGILSGLFGTGIIGPLGISFIVGLNLINLIFTFIAEGERVGKHLLFALGNITINSLIFVQFFGLIVNFIG